MAIVLTNFASTTLLSDILSTDTVISVAAGTGSWFPAPTGSDYCYLVIVDPDGNREVIKLTSRTSDTLTVVRAQEGTTARAFTGGTSGARIDCRATAATFANKLDKDTGGTVAGPLTLSDTLAVAGAGTFNGAVAFNAGATLGNASGDALTINSNTASIPNGLDFTGGAVSVIDATAGGHALNRTVGDARYQPLDALLTAVAALVTSADKMPYFTAADVVALTTITAFARSFLAAADAASAQAILSLQDVFSAGSLSASRGYVKFASNSLMLQWGSDSVNTGDNTINYSGNPNFTSWSVAVGSGATADSGAQVNWPGVTSSSTSNFHVYMAHSGSVTFRWIAVGV